MGKVENDALRRKKNEHFIKAFEYVANIRNMTQGKLAIAIGSKSAYISGYKSGVRPVAEEVIESLIRESSVAPSQQIYREYLYGNSDIMLLANVSDDEIIETAMRKNNPDYDVMKKKRREAEQRLDAQLAQRAYIDPSSEQNASIAVYVQYTNRLQDDLKAKEREMTDRLADKDARIATLESALADKQKIIEARDARILQLERQIAIMQSSDLSHYPFAIGAAEHSEQPNL